MHLSFAGPAAVSVSWVTWPQEDPEYAASLHFVSLSASRRLRLALPQLQRHHHRRRRDAHCDALRALGLGSEVQWGTAPGELTRTAAGTFDCYSTTAFDSGALHRAVLGDEGGPLPANATIYYRVGDSARNAWSQEASFKAPPTVGRAALPYRLGLLGDVGQTEHSVSTLAHLEMQAPDSVMLVGDLSYADGYQPRW